MEEIVDAYISDEGMVSRAVARIVDCPHTLWIRPVRECPAALIEGAGWDVSVSGDEWVAVLFRMEPGAAEQKFMVTDFLSVRTPEAAAKLQPEVMAAFQRAMIGDRKPLRAVTPEEMDLIRKIWPGPVENFIAGYFHRWNKLPIQGAPMTEKLAAAFRDHGRQNGPPRRPLHRAAVEMVTGWQRCGYEKMPAAELPRRLNMKLGLAGKDALTISSASALRKRLGLVYTGVMGRPIVEF